MEKNIENLFPIQLLKNEFFNLDKINKENIIFRKFKCSKI